MKTATIVGAGLVGSLWAVYLSKAGFQVQIFERRSNIREADISAGKSINLALSERGWKALKTVGLADQIRKIAIPMHGRIMHDMESNLSFQPYGQEGEFINSVSRGGLNAMMMDIAESHGAKIFYHEKCYDADAEKGIVYLKNTISKEKSEVKSDLIFATDGAFSAVRYAALQKMSGFNFSQEYVEDGYREILLPANPDGSYKLEKNALHIWPRGRFMLIALPNEDGSFTCTLFMPHKGHQSSFENLNSKEKVNDFFKNTFPDFYELMPEVGEKWSNNPLSSLAVIKCYPWTYGKIALMGDAAHATVPFYGQGMNAGFEDCTVLWDIMQKHDGDWSNIFETYQKQRKADADAMQDLSMHNYYVMRDFVGDPKFLLQKKLERKIQELFPDKYTPLYSMVTFSHTPYAEALQLGKKQDQAIKNILAEYPIQDLFDSGKIEDWIRDYMTRDN